MRYDGKDVLSCGKMFQLSFFYYEGKKFHDILTYYIFFLNLYAHVLAITHSNVLQFFSCSLKLCKKGDPSGEFIGPVLQYS